MKSVSPVLTCNEFPFSLWKFFNYLSFFSPKLTLGNLMWKLLISSPFSQRCPWNYRRYFYLLSVLKWFLFDSCEQFQLQALVCKYPPFPAEQRESSASRNGVWGLYDFLYYLCSKQKQELKYFCAHELFKCSNTLFQNRFTECWCSRIMTVNRKRKAS